MLDKIINKQLVFYSMFYNFNKPIAININKDLKHYKLNKKDFTKVKYNLINALCNKKSLEWNEGKTNVVFYPVNHLKIFLDNFNFVNCTNIKEINLDELIEYYKNYCCITSLPLDDEKYLKDNFNYMIDYSLPF